MTGVTMVVQRQPPTQGFSSFSPQMKSGVIITSAFRQARGWNHLIISGLSMSHRKERAFRAEIYHGQNMTIL